MGVIRIGTCVKGDSFYSSVEEIVRRGFESIQLYFPESLGSFNIADTERISRCLAKGNLTLHSVGLYGNPIEDRAVREGIVTCLKNASSLGVKVLGTFAGAVENGTVESSLPPFKKYFSEFLRIAKDNDVKIAIENYPAYGFWYGVKSNIGFCPRAWELLFNEIDDPCLGLEWEPSHQIDQFIDPIQQLRKWAPKVVHVHGKDCHVDFARLREVGILSCEAYSSHRFPGFGDTDWRQVFSILKENDYSGEIAIEGFHDPVYHGDTEIEGQSLALSYLRKCREES